MMDIISGLIGGEKAEDAQAAASRRAEAAIREAMAQGRTDLSPYMQTGTGASSALARLYGLGGQPADMSAFTESPDYQFARDQGLQGVERSASARGGLFSGAAGKALQGYGQGLASQQFSDYFNRMAGLAGQGQNAASTLYSGAMGGASNIGNIQQNAGENRANMIAGQWQGFGDLGGEVFGSMKPSQAPQLMSSMFGMG